MQERNPDNNFMFIFRLQARYFVPKLLSTFQEANEALPVMMYSSQHYVYLCESYAIFIKSFVVYVENFT
jgi:hypothetical protein